jgi:putative toxin-antitoxin system antitoxin component (TIGR02293 family)
MASVSPQTTKTTNAERTPTEYLIRNVRDLSPMTLCRCVAEGFTLNDVRAMLDASGLLSTKQIMGRIMSRSSRTIQRQIRSKHPTRLTPQQSAVAFQYAKVFEQATLVFGTQQLAEKWLSRPCRFLEGNVPLEMIDNSLGFQVVEDYLWRIQYGVYQ